MDSKQVLFSLALCALLLVQSTHCLVKIGKMSLKNGGGFVARIKVAYTDDDGEKHFTDSSSDITLGTSRSVNLDDLGIPAGSRVTMLAFVVWGSDNEGTRQFEYEPGSQTCAKFVITGTTLSNDLGLIGTGSC